MTKKLLFWMLLILMSHSVYAWDKSKYDIISGTELRSLQKGMGIGYDGQGLKKQASEITLIQGGYFTLGTNQGLSATHLDDHCGITFGHPYALTSYPLVGIDGYWGNLEKFWDIYQSQPIAQGDSLVLTYSGGKFEFVFSFKMDVTGQNIILTSLLKNGDTQSHTFGMGLVFDPGLGKKGDGWAELNHQNVLRDTLLASGAIPSQLVIKERIGVVAGLKIQIDFSAFLPDELILANWKDIYQNHGPDFSYSQLRKLYDLALKMVWKEQMVPAGTQLSRTVTFNLQQPDFNTSLFMRWDLPGFLSIENNLLFPRSFDSFVEITNVTSNLKSNSVLKFGFPDELFNATTQYQLNVPGNEIVYQKVNLQSKEIYEDKIVDLSVTFQYNGEILDSILRQVYVPSIPVSDTGLVCTIDTVMTAKYPQIGFIFEAQVQATGQKIFNLTSENVFLYENDNRISKFTMGKDTTGGVSIADVVFVLDCSGSMGDDIQKVRNNISEFCDSLVARGVDYRLGVVTFSTTVDAVHDFTNNVEQFKSWLTNITLWGGRENSLEALYRATELSFRPNSKRTFVWITDMDDQDYPVYPEINLTIQQTVDRLLLYNITVHSICEPHLQTPWCNAIIEPTGGNFYDIHGNFRDILLDISRVKSTGGRYLISYTSPGAIQGVNQIKLVIHYAGLGGTGYAEYKHGGLGNQLQKTLACYPNPFNPTIQITLNLDEYSEGTVEIFNIMGQRVRSFPLTSTDQRRVIMWDARDDFSREVGVGTYFIKLNMLGKDGKLQQHETAKVLYLK